MKEDMNAVVIAWPNELLDTINILSMHDRTRILLVMNRIISMSE